MGRRSKNHKHYVVWEGRKPGIYRSWPDCQAAISKYANAKYKAFPNRQTAEQAYREGPENYWGGAKFVSPLSEAERAALGQPVAASLCVDAACNTTSKVMEYRGVWLDDKTLAFEQGPIPGATNNIGEFLAIVHGLAHLRKRSLQKVPIYSDSRTALAWVKNRRVNSQAMAKGETSAVAGELVARALRWLHDHDYANPLLKWHTKAWGEIPADYGRK